MTAKRSWFVLGVLLVGIAVGLVLHQASSGVALAQRGGGTSAGPHYTVVHTEGHNLIVTDNQKNTLYFYTVDKEQPVGSPLHLRGSIDLSQVGGSTLTPQKSCAAQRRSEMRKRILTGGTVLALWLAAAATAEAQYGYGGAAYNPYTGGVTQASGGYNPYTGRGYGETTTVNPYTGRTTQTESAYNPYTGAHGAAVQTTNPYTGTTHTAAGGYNPYTGTSAAGRTAYNPYSGAHASAGAATNPYTGTTRTGTSAYNPMTGGSEQSRTAYNPYTGNAVHAQEYHNPYTGNTAYRVRGYHR